MKKIKIKNYEKPPININCNNCFLIQIILLVLHYGFEKTMPLWVVWFPTIIFALFIVLIIIIILIFLIGMFIKMIIDWVIY